MKRIISILMAVLLSLGISFMVVAAELTGCTVTVDPAAAASGTTVTVAVRIADNPGFTNFAVLLDYDREHLTLKSINTAENGTNYLCGSHTASSVAWEDTDGTSFGYIVSASAEPVKENGILFTATFEIADEYVGELEVTPVVQYIRNNEANFAIFETIHAAVNAGTIGAVPVGDVNGDGVIEYDDVMLAYQAFLGEVELTGRQMAAADLDGNGTIEASEYEAIYRIYIGG